MDYNNWALRIIATAIYKIAFFHGYVTGLLIKAAEKIHAFFCKGGE